MLRAAVEALVHLRDTNRGVYPCELQFPDERLSYEADGDPLHQNLSRYAYAHLQP
jgi:hypothetical protein